MATATLIGLDIGKHNFHRVGHNLQGRQVLQRQLSRGQLIAFLARHSAPRIVMETCCSTHWLGHKLACFGHAVQRIAPPEGSRYQNGRASMKGAPVFFSFPASCRARDDGPYLTPWVKASPIKRPRWTVAARPRVPRCASWSLRPAH